jgi:hypothetical protein
LRGRIECVWSEFGGRICGRRLNWPLPLARRMPLVSPSSASAAMGVDGAHGRGLGALFTRSENRVEGSCAYSRGS